MVIHCGDLFEDAKKIENITGIPVTSVRGNCDDYEGPDINTADTPGGKILVVHGHRYGNDPLKLSYLAKENGASAVCTGHTHIAGITEAGGVKIINPGSLSKPRDGSGGTFAIIMSEEGSIRSSIVKYDTFSSKEDSSKTRGKLRDMINYSDGF